MRCAQAYDEHHNNLLLTLFFRVDLFFSYRQISRIAMREREYLNDFELFLGTNHKLLQINCANPTAPYNK